MTKEAQPALLAGPAVAAGGERLGPATPGQSLDGADWRQWRQKPSTNHARPETLARSLTRIEPISPNYGSFSLD